MPVDNFRQIFKGGLTYDFGAERLAMLKYGINDIRVFYNTDLRELENFSRR